MRSSSPEPVAGPRPRRKKSRAVFLDRDGVIVEEVHYLRRIGQLRLLPGAAAAIARLCRAGFRMIMISNQSAVGRGYLSAGTLDKIHAELLRRLKRHGALLDDSFYCPHKPEARCSCRKPRLGMIKAAARRFDLDLKRSFMVGDTTTDLKTARDAGCRAVLVLTGKAGRDGRYDARPHAECADLSQAAEWILKAI